MQDIAVAAKIVGATQWVAIAEGIMVPLPHDRAAGVGDPMRRAKMIRRDIELPRWRREHSDRSVGRLPGRRGCYERVSVRAERLRQFWMIVSDLDPARDVV